MNMGYNGLEILMARRQQQLFQDTMFWLVSAGVFVDPTRPPNPDQLHEQNTLYRQGFGFDSLGNNQTFYRNTGFWSSWNSRAYDSYERRIDGFVDVPGEYDPQFSGQLQTLQIRSDLPDYARSVYTGKLGENLTKCINKVFNKEVTGLNGVTATGANLLEPQRLKNAPKVDDKSFTSFVLGGGTGPLAAGRSFYGDENRYGPNGTLHIANNLTDVLNPSTGNVALSKFEVYQRTYVHELGNLLARKITGNPLEFGNPSGIAGNLGSSPDTDTGAALEECVFGNVSP
jgi:hypothetical protein